MAGKIANEKRAIDRAELTAHDVDLIERFQDGAAFRVRRYIGGMGGPGSPGTFGSRWQDFRVRWFGGSAGDWRKAKCSCQWGQDGGRGCWHVQAVRLAWLRREKERQARLKAEHEARQNG